LQDRLHLAGRWQAHRNYDWTSETLRFVTHENGRWRWRMKIYISEDINRHYQHIPTYPPTHFPSYVLDSRKNKEMVRYWPTAANYHARAEDFVPVVPETISTQTGGAIEGFNRLIANEMCNDEGFPYFLSTERLRAAQLFMELEMRFMSAEAGPYTDGSSYAELGISMNPQDMTPAFVHYIAGDLKEDWAV